MNSGQMITIYIENKPFEVNEGNNLLETCLSLGFDIPYFCWHPALGSVGACRQCAVKQFRDDKDTKGTIVMSCMTPVSDGLRISIDDPEVKRFRASVIEWLMLNHPHDCPVCDEGGECHLQDMTVMTGHVYRKTRFKKRTYRNQELGPFVNHEMNRCIQCYRCVRFYRDFAGGRDLNVFSAHDRVYFGRYKDGLLESEFSGNLVEICPTGVFTDKTLKKHYTRPWDLQCAPSICVHCSLGCNTLPGERHGTLRRVRNRFNDEVNGYFLCDRGRYGYEFVNSPDRIRKPVLKTSGSAGIAGHAHPEDVQKYLRERFHFGTRAIGIGSPKASLEANYALRTLVGPESFYLGVSATDYRLVTLIASILKSGPVPAASLKDIAHSDAVLILGEDVTNTAPLAALALRQTIRQKPMKLVDEARLPRWNQMAADYVIQDSKGPLFVATPEQTKLDDIASGIYRAAPPDLAHFGFAIAYELLGKAPLASPSSRETGLLIDNIASALKAAERPLIVCGTGCKNEAVIQAAANIAWALNSIGGNAGLCYIVPECNSMGLGLIGGGSIEEAFYAIDSLQAETLVMIESDLDRLTEKSASDSFLTKFKHVIIIDSLPSETGSKAELLLPAATFAESDGTFVNNEGRAQRFYKVIAQSGEVRENWRWLIEMLKAAGNREAAAWNTIDDINKSMAEDLPVFGKVLQIAPPAGFRISGMKIPRQPNRYSGRTAMYANMSVHEPQSPDDTDSPLAFSMEGYEGVPPSSLVTHYWVPGWNSVQAIDKYQREVGGPLKWGNPGIRLLEPSTVTSPNYFQPGIFREAPSHTGATNGGRAVGRKKKS